MTCMNHNQYPACMTRVPADKPVSALFPPDIEYRGRPNWSKLLELLSGKIIYRLLLTLRRVL
jgi:hypothetical protein